MFLDNFLISGSSFYRKYFVNRVSQSCFVFIAAFFFCAASSSIEIKKGDIDHRIYEFHVLDNELKVLLVSDSTIDKAAAALSVGVGSYSDPYNRQGLAHFLEHMLFLGTKKYPDPKGYQAYISKQGGSNNAFTAQHSTTYYFDINNDYLEQTLDRFSEFFISPLFDAEYVNRERNAVHSEYQSKLQDDFRRSYDAYRSIVNPLHPAAKFSVGSLNTLANRPDAPVREDLIQFYQEHYSADKMTLVVMGNYSINQLKGMVDKRFKKIKKSEARSFANKEEISLFLPNQLPLELISQPVKELRQMYMSFELPSIQLHYREKPVQFIASLLGSEGKGSLLSLLKQEGLAEALTVGSSDNQDGTGSFYISFQLTPKGIKERSLVRELTFYAINKIKQEGIQAWRYKEKQLLADIAFRFRENARPINAVVSLAGNLQKYPVEDVISGDYLLETFDSDLIKGFFNYLTPKNLFVSTVFPEAITNKISKFYQVPYASNSIDVNKIPNVKHSKSEPLHALKQQLLLPEKNPFIPRTVELFKKDEQLSKPIRFFENAKNVWVKQDLSFNVPRVKVRLSINSPLISGGVRGSVLATLYTELLQDQLNEFNYPGLLAGAGVFVRSDTRGINITAQGYYDALPKLSKQLIAVINKPQFDEVRFEQIKSDLLRAWRNNQKTVPYRQLYKQLITDLYSPYWSDKEKMRALEAINLEDIYGFAKEWRKGTEIEGLFYGNLSVDWLELWNDIIPEFNRPNDSDRPSEASIKPIQVGQIESEQGQYQIRQVEHNDQAVVLYTQSLDDSLSNQVKMMVLRQILQAPFYSSLRTEQQLGYIVFLSGLPLYELQGSVFIVQSPDANIEAMQTAILEFIGQYEKQFPEDISAYKKAVITKLAEEPANLSAQADTAWLDLSRGYTKLDRKQTLIALVNKLTAADIKAFYQEVISSPSKHLWVYSSKPKEPVYQKKFEPPVKFYSYP